MARNEKINKEISKRLRALREKNRLFQHEVADMTGFSRQTINGVENGNVRLNSDLLIAYCNAFHVSPNEIIGIAGAKNDILPDLAELLVSRGIIYQKKILKFLENIDEDTIDRYLLADKNTLYKLNKIVRIITE